MVIMFIGYSKGTNHMWHSYGTKIQHMWYSCGTKIQHMWCSYGTKIQHMWYSYGTNHCDAAMAQITVMQLWYKDTVMAQITWFRDNYKLLDVAMIFSSKLNMACLSYSTTQGD